MRGLIGIFPLPTKDTAVMLLQQFDEDCFSNPSAPNYIFYAISQSLIESFCKLSHFVVFLGSISTAPVKNYKNS